jgi:hypothetical protein
MDEIKNFRNQFLKECHPETHLMIMNAEQAYAEGLITLEETWDAVRAAITAETEQKLLAPAAPE